MRVVSSHSSPPSQCVQTANSKQKSSTHLGSFSRCCRSSLFFIPFFLFICYYLFCHILPLSLVASWQTAKVVHISSRWIMEWQFAKSVDPTGSVTAIETHQLRGLRWKLALLHFEVLPWTPPNGNPA